MIIFIAIIVQRQLECYSCYMYGVSILKIIFLMVTFSEEPWKQSVICGLLTRCQPENMQ